MSTRHSIAATIAAAGDPTAWQVPACPCHPQDPVAHFEPARVARWYLMRERVLRVFEAAAPAALKKVLGDVLDKFPDPTPALRMSLNRDLRDIEVLEGFGAMDDDQISTLVERNIRKTYGPYLHLFKD